MIKDLKNVFKSSAIYSIGNLATKLIGFILLPLYTDHLTTHDYGMLGLLEATATILIAVLSLRIPTAMIRWCADYKDLNKQKSIVFTALAGIIVIVVLFNVVLQPFSAAFSQIFFEREDLAIYFQLTFITTGLEILGRIPLELLRFREKARFYVTINAIKLSLVLSLNIYLIAYAGMGIKGILISQLAGALLIILLSIKFMASNIHFQFDWVRFREMMKYGFPLIFSTLSAMLLSLADRYILPFYHDYDNLGLYNLGYKIASVTNVFLIHSFRLGFLPIAFKKHKESGFKKLFSKVMTYFILLVVLFVLLLSFFSKEVIYFVAQTPEYRPAHLFIPLLGFVFIFKAIEFFFTLGFHFQKQTKYNIRIVFAGLVINVFMNFILIPPFGIWGAIVATLISSMVTLFYSFWLSNKIYPVQYEHKKTALMVGAAILFTIILFVINPVALGWRLLIKVGLLFFVSLLFWTKVLEKEEKDAVKKGLLSIKAFFNNRA